MAERKLHHTTYLCQFLLNPNYVPWRLTFQPNAQDGLHFGTLRLRLEDPNSAIIVENWDNHVGGWDRSLPYVPMVSGEPGSILYSDGHRPRQRF